MSQALSWGNFPKVRQGVEVMHWRTDELPTTAKKILPYGYGRSYGDVCLNDGGVVISTRRLNHFISFDNQTGVLRCEAGVTMGQILELVVPQGWFLPVTPGTKFVSVGGAIANDVHGKNHHRAGTFGGHVRQLELLRSHGQRLLCSPTQNQQLWRATIGGLGLTGLITWAEIKLKKISGPLLDVETIRMKNLDDWLALTEQSDKAHEYTVAWVDTSAGGRQLGRGLFMRGNHQEKPAEPTGLSERGQRVGWRIGIAIPLPRWFMNAGTLRAFNFLYGRRQIARSTRQKIHYNTFFYPLDVVDRWYNLYGPAGLAQCQCVVPPGNAAVIARLLTCARKFNMFSPLTVLKAFGSIPSPGLMSFPTAGITLALDFPNRPRTAALFVELEKIVLEVGGKIYPAKDAHMSAQAFQMCYPQWLEFAQYIDPAFSSSFWRRVTAKMSS